MNETFSANCGKCFALCCTALAFERGRYFAHDKAAGQPCHHLAGDFTCTIHARREQLGYDGCEAFDCLGAGQRASAIFAAENWRRDPALARRLYASFSLLLRLQEMRRALTTAEDLDLGVTLHERRIALLEMLSEQADSQREDVVEQAVQTLEECRDYLRQIRTVLAA